MVGPAGGSIHVVGGLLMIVETGTRCPECGYDNDAAARSCGLCGALLGARPAVRPAGRGAEPPVSFETPVEVADEDEREVPVFGLPRPWFFLLVGVPGALVFAAGPFMRLYAWFLSALFHESGHTAAGLLVGMPSFPAISLRGHAAAHIGQQSTFMVFLIWAGLAWVAWRQRRRPVALGAMVAVVLAYPLIAFTSAREGLILLGGHCGELAFATLCLWRAMTGGFTHNELERGAYSVLGWVLVGGNVSLCWGLATSAAARAWYAENGSFGLTNDYIRVAHDVVGTGLPPVAAVMLVVSLLPVPLGIALARWLR